MLRRHGDTLLHPSMCRCGDVHEFHEHYRGGSDCARLDCDCSRFTRRFVNGSGSIHVGDRR